MVDIIKDSRKWKIALILDNTNCPFLYYPNNIYGCKLLKDEIDDRCTLENCGNITQDLINKKIKEI